ncbi:MAG: hypothetical protein ABI372_02800 [Ginsengibacter sp.]
MDEEAKIQLSMFEMELVNNTEWIFTKQLIIKKVYHLFGRLNDEYKKIVDAEKQFLPLELQKPGGKITKGENYKGLPYLILDYPSIFGKENIFAVRTLFWWGNFFSISFHLSGKAMIDHGDHLNKNMFLKENNFSVCVHETQWEHDFDRSNFVNINELTKNEIERLYEKSYFKIAKKIELRDWNLAEVFLINTFKEIIKFIKLSFPGDKITL